MQTTDVSYEMVLFNVSNHTIICDVNSATIDQWHYLNMYYSPQQRSLAGDIEIDTNTAKVTFHSMPYSYITVNCVPCTSHTVLSP